MEVTVRTATAALLVSRGGFQVYLRAVGPTPPTRRATSARSMSSGQRTAPTTSSGASACSEPGPTVSTPGTVTASPSSKAGTPAACRCWSPTRDRTKWHGSRSSLVTTCDAEAAGSRGGRGGPSMARSRTVHVRRVYEDPAQTDGARVLVDRIWPRGMTKEQGPPRRVVQAGRTLHGAAQVVQPRPRTFRGIQPPLPDRAQRSRTRRRSGTPARPRPRPAVDATHRNQASRDQRSRGARRASPELTAPLAPLAAPPCLRGGNVFLGGAHAETGR